MSTHESLTAELRGDLKPGTALENILFRQIARAAWRLEQCETTENDPGPAVDRARSCALNIVLKATAELRRLQTNRRIGTEIAPGEADQPLVVHKEVANAAAGHERRLALRAKAKPAESSFCKTPLARENFDIPRGAPCPCNSGNKYKRCCGKDAPPVLHFGVHREARNPLPKAA